MHNELIIKKNSKIKEIKMEVIQSFFIRSFIFFGPIGRLIPLSSSLYSLRFFYVFLPIGVLFFVWYGKNKLLVLKKIKFLLPIFFYMLMSSVIVSIVNVSYTIDNENPIVRLMLFLLLFVFTVFSAYIVSKYP